MLSIDLNASGQLSIHLFDNNLKDASLESSIL